MPKLIFHFLVRYVGNQNVLWRFSQIKQIIEQDRLPEWDEVMKQAEFTTSIKDYKLLANWFRRLHAVRRSITEIDITRGSQKYGTVTLDYENQGFNIKIVEDVLREGQNKPQPTIQFKLEPGQLQPLQEYMERFRNSFDRAHPITDFE